MSDQMLRGVWTRLRDRLSSLDSDSSMLHDDISSRDPSVCSSFHRHVCGQAHWKALDWRPHPSLAADAALSSPRPHCARGRA